MKNIKIKLLIFSVSFTLDELSEHVLENTTVLVVSNFDIGVESDLDLEGFASACLNSEGLVDLEVTTVEIDIESFLSGKS